MQGDKVCVRGKPSGLIPIEKNCLEGNQLWRTQIDSQVSWGKPTVEDSDWIASRETSSEGLGLKPTIARWWKKTLWRWRRYRRSFIWVRSFFTRIMLLSQWKHENLTTRYCWFVNYFANSDVDAMYVACERELRPNLCGEFIFSTINFNDSVKAKNLTTRSCQIDRPVGVSQYNPYGEFTLKSALLLS